MSRAHGDLVFTMSLCSFLIDFLVVFPSARILLLRFGAVIGCDE